MGIAEAMKPKTRYPPPGGFSANLLMTGEAELAVQQKPELLQCTAPSYRPVARWPERGHGVRRGDRCEECANGEEREADQLAAIIGTVAMFRARGSIRT